MAGEECFYEPKKKFKTSNKKRKQKTGKQRINNEQNSANMQRACGRDAKKGGRNYICTNVLFVNERKKRPVN